MQKKKGRKTYGEDMQIKERYCELTEPFFKVLKKFLASDNKADKKWAVEQLNRGFVKMIPQVLAGDKDNPIVIEGVNISIRK